MESSSSLSSSSSQFLHVPPSNLKKLMQITRPFDFPTDTPQQFAGRPDTQTGKREVIPRQNLQKRPDAPLKSPRHLTVEPPRQNSRPAGDDKPTVLKPFRRPPSHFKTSSQPIIFPAPVAPPKAAWGEDTQLSARSRSESVMSFRACIQLSGTIKAEDTKLDLFYRSPSVLSFRGFLNSVPQQQQKQDIKQTRQMIVPKPVLPLQKK
jgi:hypothetical protein